METTEVAATIREAVEEEHAVERAEQAHADHFRKRAALLIAALAGLLAITALGNEHANRTMVTSNIQATDMYAFFQAKNIRQTSNLLAADDLQSLVEVTNPPDPTRTAIEERIDRYRATAARYESEPETGEGKQELLARAETFVHERHHAEEQSPNFVFALALFQIGIVVASVAVITLSRTMVFTAAGLGAVATLLMLNGFFLWFSMPIG
jgi:ABC-type nickel/cobalt efflux system permease component RcnA